MRVVRTSLSFYPRAECQDEGCDWVWPISRRTRDAAKRHVRHFGHTVTVIVEARDNYYAQDEQ